MDEQQALVRLKQGDLNGLEFLVQVYQVRAVHTAVLITGDRGQAEDIVQNAFIRAAERIDQYDLQRPFGPWFLRSVVNDAIKSVQQQQRWIFIDEGESEELIDLYDPTPLPEEILEVEETRQEIWRALQQLPPHQRATVVLHYYLEMSEKEIAEKFHDPAGTIRWWLYTAKQRLAKLLAPQINAPERHDLSSTSVQKPGEQE